jgi:CRISPR-associated protein (TIGR02584 family)
MLDEPKLAGTAADERRQILLCVAGGTPAIITETLWALKERGECIHEIRVITTEEGRAKILTGIVNKRGAADESLLDKDHGQFFKFIRDFPEVGEIEFDEQHVHVLNNRRDGLPSGFDWKFDWKQDQLQDILDDEDSRKVARQICEVVQRIAKDRHVRIHASIAGGRKTMSLYLMAAMQLFGRKDDEMSHVLVSKEAEFGAPKFFYKTPQPEPVLDPSGKPKTKADGSALTTDDIKIHLAKIRFIRLSGVGSEMLKQQMEYDDFVDKAQENLERFNLSVDLKKSQVKVGKHLIDLGSGSDFFVYVMFAYLRWRGRGQDGCLRVDEISLEDFDAVCRMISRAHGKECGYQDFSLLREESLKCLSYQLHKLRNPNLSDSDVLSSVKKTISESISVIKNRVQGAKVSDDFLVVNLNKNRRNVEPVYGLKNLEPGRIIFE